MILRIYSTQTLSQIYSFQGLTDKVAIISKAKENLIFAIAAMSALQRSELSYTKDEFIRKCSFNGRECSIEK